ncbi:hypothetical protein GCM10022280_22110 [Sphingomonas swuensis]|uniref:Heme oxygenase n=1 Tax=Sphingomonas swuensis TaxID=977800 RepID=A0ABP7T5Q2_9SPHN
MMVRFIQQIARRRLRDGTADCHERVDALFSGADLGSRIGYERFLVAQATAFLPAERSLEEGGIAAVLGDWPSRRRSHLIAQDLRKLGQQLPSGEDAPTLNGTPALLGGAYVLEGPRLGAALLRRQVPSHLPVAFLSSNYPGAWRTIVETLDEDLRDSHAIDQAIEAARSVFALFERSGQQMSVRRITDVA